MHTWRVRKTAGIEALRHQADTSLKKEVAYAHHPCLDDDPHVNQLGVVASFGITGVWTERNPEVVRCMVDESHLIINHTYKSCVYDGFVDFSSRPNPF